jgi:hypothetical protein
MGLGNNPVSVSDEYASLNNPAGTAGLKHSAVVFTLRNLYSVNGLTLMAAAGHLKYKKEAFLVSIYRFGDELLSEQKVGAGFSHKIAFVQLGLKLNYLQYRTELSGSTGNFVFEFGGIAEIIPKIAVAAHIFNLSGSETGRVNRSRIPVSLKAGMRYEPGEKTILIWGIHKSIGEPNIISLGLEHFLREFIYIRSGCRLNPAIFYFGFGLPVRKFQADIAISIHPILGISSEYSLFYIIN